VQQKFAGRGTLWIGEVSFFGDARSHAHIKNKSVIHQVKLRDSIRIRPFRFVLDHKPATEDLMTNFEIYVGLVD
jgi:hypothetical protein